MQTAVRVLRGPCVTVINGFHPLRKELDLELVIAFVVGAYLASKNVLGMVGCDVIAVPKLVNNHQSPVWNRAFEPGRYVA